MVAKVAQPRKLFSGYKKVGGSFARNPSIFAAPLFCLPSVPLFPAIYLLLPGSFLALSFPLWWREVLS